MTVEVVGRSWALRDSPRPAAAVRVDLAGVVRSYALGHRPIEDGDIVKPRALEVVRAPSRCLFDACWPGFGKERW